MEEKIKLGIKELNMVRETKKSTLIFNIISGFLLLIIGITGLFFKPLQTAYSVTWAFGFIFMVSGIATAISSFTLKKQEIKQWWLILVQGIATAFIGFYLMRYTLLEVTTLVYLFGIFLISFTIVKIIATREDWIFTLLQFILGWLMIAKPVFFTAWGYITIFIIFIINGIYTIYISLKILKYKKQG